MEKQCLQNQPWKIDNILSIKLQDIIKCGLIRKGERCNANFYKKINDRLITIDFSINFETKLPFCTIQIVKDGISFKPCKVYISEKVSNLGKGSVYYFICPITGKRSRFLFNPSCKETWGCRTAFDKPIYYSLQLCKKWEKYNVSHKQVDMRLSYLQALPVSKKYYKGEKIKRAVQIDFLIRKRSILDLYRHSSKGFPKSLHKYTPINLNINNLEYLKDLGSTPETIKYLTGIKNISRKH